MSRHTLDGGLSSPYRTVVRNAVVERLSPLLRTNLGFLAAISKLGGQLRRMDDEAITQMYTALLGRTPSILVACGDRTAQPNGIGGYKQMTFLDVHVYFVSKHQRSLLARVESDVVSAGVGEVIPPLASADPGIDVAMQCAEELLVGQQLERAKPSPPAAPAAGETGTGVIRHMELRREEEFVTNNQITIWEQTYVVQVSRSIDRTRGVLARLLGIDTTIHPPGQPASPARVDFSTDFEGPPP